MWCHLLTETQQLVAVVIDRRGKEAQLKLVDTAGGVTGQTVGDVFGRAAQGVIGLALDGIAQADRLAQHAHCKRLVDSSGRLAQLTDALNRGPHTALRWPLRKPAVTQLGGAPHRRRRGSTHPDRRAARACRGRANPHRGGRITLADKAEPGVDVAGIGGLERRAHRNDRLLQRRATIIEVHAKRLELALHVAGAHAEDHSAAGERVQRCEALRHSQRMPVGGNVDVAEQPEVGAAGAKPSQRGHRVIPGGADVQVRGHGNVIADRHVTQPGLIGGRCDTGQLGGTGIGLPRLNKGGALRLDRQLNAPKLLTLTDHGDHRPSLLAVSR